MAAAAVVAGTLLAFGCLDAISPGGTYRARLSIYPVFEGSAPAAGRLAAPSDVDSFVILIVNPPRSVPDTFVRRLQPGEDTIRITIDVPLDAQRDTLSVVFSGYSSVTSLLLYQGTLTVVIAPEISVTPRPVNASYVGPGRGVRTITASPRAAGVRRNETVQVNYVGRDSAGAAMPADSVPVRYSTSNRSVATVSQSGLVTAVALGQARIFVTSLANRAIEDTCVVEVSEAPTPAISLSRSSVTFQDTAGTTDPAPQTLEVTNTGGGTLSGLTAGVTYGAGGSGWLTPSLSSTTAPSTLTLSAAKGTLTPGTYTATVAVSAAGVSNSPQNVSVTFTIAVSPVASLRLSPGFTVVRPSGTITLTATARDGSGNTVSSAGTTYLSRTPTVATVNSSTGLVTGLAAGTAVMVGTLLTVSDSIVVAVAADSVAVASAIADQRAFDAVSVNDTVRVVVAVNLSGVAPEKLGSYNDSLVWNTAVLRYVRDTTVSGDFTAPTVNRSGVNSGVLRFGAADPSGQSGPNVTLIRITFVAQGAGSTTLTQTLSDLTAAGSFIQMLPRALVVHGRVRVQ